MKKILLMLLMILFIPVVNADYEVRYPDNTSVTVITEEEAKDLQKEENWKLLGTYETDGKGEIFLPVEWTKGRIKIEEIYTPEGYEKSSKLFYANLEDGGIKILNNTSEVLGDTIEENPKTGIVSLIPLMLVLIVALIILGKSNKRYKYFIPVLVLITIPVIAETGFKILKVDEKDNPIKGVKFNIYGGPEYDELISLSIKKTFNSDDECAYVGGPGWTLYERIGSNHSLVDNMVDGVIINKLTKYDNDFDLNYSNIDNNFLVEDVKNAIDNEAYLPYNPLEWGNRRVGTKTASLEYRLTPGYYLLSSYDLTNEKVINFDKLSQDANPYYNGANEFLFAGWIDVIIYIDKNEVKIIDKKYYNSYNSQFGCMNNLYEHTNLQGKDGQYPENSYIRLRDDMKAKYNVFTNGFNIDINSISWTTCGEPPTCQK